MTTDRPIPQAGDRIDDVAPDADGQAADRSDRGGVATSGPSALCSRPAEVTPAGVGGVGGYEIHEAVAAQVLAALREFETRTGFGIPDERLNLNGGVVGRTVLRA